MSLNDSSLPVLDLVKAKDPNHRLNVARELVRALETVGFLYVDNVQGFDSKKLMENTRWLFGLPEEEKRRVSKKAWNPAGKNQFRGYSKGDPTKVSYKEAFEIGQEPSEGIKHEISESAHPFFKEPNLWPTGPERSKKFHSEVMAHYNLGCGREENWFESLIFPGTVSSLALLHYPTAPLRHSPSGHGRRHTFVLSGPRRFRSPPSNQSERRIGQRIARVPTTRCADFKPSSANLSNQVLVTLLDTFQYPGLQIWREDGQWMEVPVRPNSLVMNIGQTLSAISGGRFKATRHRVRDILVDRFSAAFFLEPKYDGDITVRMFGTEGEDNRLQSEEEVIKHYGPWLIDKMRNKPEYRDFVALEFSTV
nr:hypothetical protein BaRGS_003139 [Batillaria attramentaria]